MMYDSVLFDLDGTLWDSTEVVVKAWNEILRPIGKQVSKQDIHGIMGMRKDEITKRLFPDLSADASSDLFDRCGELECRMLACEGGTLYSGLEETLEILSKRIPLFIVSNCAGGYIEAFLHSHQMRRYFAGTECAGNTGLSKGENIRLMIKRNCLKKPVYVGDTQIDADAAEEAGIPFLFAAYGFGDVQIYEEKIQSPRDLIAFFK